MARDFKVVLLPGGFYAAPLSHPASEAHASRAERARLLRFVGLAPDGTLRGLTADEARRLAHRLTKARQRTANQPRGRRRA